MPLFDGRCGQVGLVHGATGRHGKSSRVIPVVRAVVRVAVRGVVRVVDIIDISIPTINIVLSIDFVPVGRTCTIERSHITSFKGPKNPGSCCGAAAGSCWYNRYHQRGN